MTITFKESIMDFMAIIEEAMKAGQQAEAKHINQYGEDMYCGFGWVEIPNGRSPFVTFCRKNGIGSKHWRKGWYIWRPTQNCSQSMTVNEIGAQAFAEVLNNHGIEAFSASRPD